MRLFSFLAVLSAVLSAGGTQACFFFKCFGKGAAAGPERRAMRVMSGTTPYLQIYTVDSNEPDPSTLEVTPDCSSGTILIVVDADAAVTWLSLDLYVTDLGATGPAVAAKLGDKKKGTLAKPPELKLKWKKNAGGPVAAAAAPSGAAPAPSAVTADKWIWVYEYTYKVDVDPGHNYGAYATGQYTDGSDVGTATSNTVKFHTKSSGAPPFPPEKKK